MRVNLNNRIETLEKHMMTSSRKPKTNKKGIHTHKKKKSTLASILPPFPPTILSRMVLKHLTSTLSHRNKDSTINETSEDLWKNDSCISIIFKKNAALVTRTNVLNLFPAA